LARPLHGDRRPREANSNLDNDGETALRQAIVDLKGAGRHRRADSARPCAIAPGAANSTQQDFGARDEILRKVIMWRASAAATATGNLKVVSERVAARNELRRARPARNDFASSI
jgi:ABC-type protease/lipase transport system fused ATPase/permease subunit